MNELGPALDAMGHQTIRVARIVWPPILRLQLCDRQAIGLSRAQLLHVVVPLNWQADRRRNDFGGLARTRQRAADEHVGGDLACRRQPVAEPLYLRDPFGGKARVAADARDDWLEISHGLAVANQIEV